MQRKQLLGIASRAESPQRIEAIVGTADGTSAVKTGEDVTVSCAEGEEGFVYRGRLPVRIERTNLADVSRPHTRMMMNVANPAEAFSLSLLPNDGVGLARLEFIISTHVSNASDGAGAPRPGE